MNEVQSVNVNRSIFRGLLKYYGINHKLHATQNHLPLAHNSKQTGFSSSQIVGCVSHLPQRVVLALVQHHKHGSLYFTSTEVA